MHRVLTLGGRLKIIRKRGKHFAHGGTVIALLGGDGAGKSTCARELADWLSDEFGLLTAHLGRPPRLLLTLVVDAVFRIGRRLGDRKSTRLNSSHLVISYAVFCLKKKIHQS